LIGAELATLDRYAELPVMIAANDKLTTLYEWGMQKDREIVFNHSIDQATIDAHCLILSRVYNEL